MERHGSREIMDELEEHTVGSLDTSMDRYLEHHGLWRKRIPQGDDHVWPRSTKQLASFPPVLDGSSLFRAFSEAVRLPLPLIVRVLIRLFVVILNTSSSLRCSTEMYRAHGTVRQ